MNVQNASLKLVETPVRRGTTGYIAELVEEMRKMALREGHAELAILLAGARDEAARIRDAG